MDRYLEITPESCLPWGWFWALGTDLQGLKIYHWEVALGFWDILGKLQPHWNHWLSG